MVPARYSEEMFEALDPYGNVKYTVYPEAEHDSWTATYNDMNLYEWLLSHKRSEQQ